MQNLEEFISLLEGRFDNKEQSEKNTGIPYCEHTNSILNSKIRNLPENFQGVFLLEESYYTTKGNTHASPHIFLFTEDGDNIILTSYEIPEGLDKKSLDFSSIESIDYKVLRCSEKFTPAIYKKIDGIWEGGSVSMFSPTLKFTLHERFSSDVLEVSESMEAGGRRVFGFDEPILYKRI